VVSARKAGTTGRRRLRVAGLAAFIDEAGDSFRAVRILLAELDALRPHLPGTLGDLENIAIQPLGTRVLPAVSPLHPAAHRDAVFLDSPWNALLSLGAGAALAGGQAGGRTLTAFRAEETSRAARWVIQLAWPATPPLTEQARRTSVRETARGHPARLPLLAMPDERTRPHHGLTHEALERYTGKALRTVRVPRALAIRAMGQP
jgi:hypothetical protein